MQPKTGIHWYRHGLRMHDNQALMECVEDVERFVPIFIFDGESAGTDLCGFVRFRFLLQSLRDLEKQFKTFKINLMCFYGKPHEVLENLIKVISFEKSSEAKWNNRDDMVKSMCKRLNVKTIECVSHTLYDPKDLLISNQNSTPSTCEEFKKICFKVGQPERPVEIEDFKLFFSGLTTTYDLYEEIIHKVPYLEHFNIKPECKEQEVCLFQGGETKALELLHKRIETETEAFKNGIVTLNLKKPVLFTKEISLSPYLTFGCLSVRRFYWDLSQAFHKYYNGEKTIFDATVQLFWREYFYQLSFVNINFYQIDGNPMSYKIPWCSKLANYSKWKMGLTGYPWIDACMRQLRQEGWIHHICRSSVAIFLTRGDLFYSWEKGLKTFVQYLVDADWTICAGNWNYISSGDSEEILSPLLNFCPIKNGKKIDPKGEYIRKYVPELKNFSLKYLYAPWKAPLDLQEEADCIIGRHYPEPCVDHEQVFNQNIAKLKQFFYSEKKEVFEKAPNTLNEFKNYTYFKFLQSEFEDF